MTGDTVDRDRAKPVGDDPARRPTEDLLAALDGLPWPIVMFDAGGRLTFANAAFDALSGHAADRVVSRDWRDLFRAPDAREDREHDQMSFSGELRRALESGHIEVHYQPIVEMATGRIVEFEALARWIHPERGPIHPAEFVPIAEASGTIGPLTQYVLERALRDVAALRAWAEDARIAVNLSTRDVRDVAIVDRVRDAIARSRLADALTLEITESAVMSDGRGVVATLEGLRALGVRLAIDDFGTGYSSLSYLQRLPVQQLKIDRSFVRALRVRSGASIVRAILDLGRTLDLDVVAEGVEDEAGWHRLVLMGCGRAQGYHIVRPMPLADAVSWSAAWRTRLGVHVAV
jgi:PAS domain S-box-containing protein